MCVITHFAEEGIETQDGKAPSQLSAMWLWDVAEEARVAPKNLPNSRNPPPPSTPQAGETQQGLHRWGWGRDRGQSDSAKQLRGLSPSQSPGLEVLCWQIRKCSALMGKLPAPYPRFWKLRLGERCFAEAGQLQSPEPGRDPRADPGIPDISDSLPTPPCC